MKATVSLPDLRRVVGVAARAASGVAGAVHSGVHLALDDDGTITATGTDMEIRAAATCTATDGDPGAVVVPAKRLVATLAAMRGETVTLAAEGVDLSLTAGRSEVTLRMLDAQQWPRFAPVDGEPCHLDEATWSALQRVVVACSTEQERTSITGVQLRGGLAAATDTFRLHATEIPDALDTYLPVKALREAFRLGDSATVTSGPNETRFDVEAGGTIWVRAMADEPPDARRLIDQPPDAWPGSFTFDADEMHAAIRLASVVASDDALVLTFGADEIEVRIVGDDIGNAAEQVPATIDGIGEGERYGMTHEFFSDAIEAVAPDGGEVTVRWLSERKPVRLIGAGVDVQLMAVFL